MMIVFLIPKLGKMFKMGFLEKAPQEFVVNIIKAQFKARKENKSNDIPNFLDVFISAMETTNIPSNKVVETTTHEGKSAAGDGHDHFDNDAKLQNIQSVQLYANQEEFETAIISNLFLLFFAGFDTTSTALASACFYLATNPEGTMFICLQLIMFSCITLTC